MKNIFYFWNINSIGGVETFFYYLAKKYKDHDITIYYSYGDATQIKRLMKYVRVKKYEGELIKCDKAFFNYNAAIIDNVEAKEYIQMVHSVPETKAGLNIHPKITRYLGVSKIACENFKNLTGKECELAYNPLEIDKPKKMLKLISATRLTKEKGKERMIRLGNLLDKAGIPYIWLVFTNDTNAIDNPNIIYMKPRLDITNYMNEADFLVQLSDSEAYCYSVVEMLAGCNKPVIVTDLPVYKEIGLNNNNSIRLDLDFKEIPINKLLKEYNFSYTPKKDNWSNFLASGKSTYKPNKKEISKVTNITIEPRQIAFGIKKGG